MKNEKLPRPALIGGETISPREAWRVFGIMAELVDSTERLAGIRPAVSVFGSARVRPDSPYYAMAENTDRKSVV